MGLHDSTRPKGLNLNFRIKTSLLKTKVAQLASDRSGNKSS